MGHHSGKKVAALSESDQSRPAQHSFVYILCGEEILLQENTHSSPDNLALTRRSSSSVQKIGRLLPNCGSSSAPSVHQLAGDQVDHMSMGSP